MRRPRPSRSGTPARGTRSSPSPSPTARGSATAGITHHGSSTFAVETIESEELLVDEIGTYAGRVLFDMEQGQDSTRLRITADGPWTVTLLPFESLRVFQDEISGQGDDLVVYMGTDGVATLDHKGERTFAVQTYGGSQELLVNEIGTYTGDQPLKSGTLLRITADGSWSVRVAS